MSGREGSGGVWLGRAWSVLLAGAMLLSLVGAGQRWAAERGRPAVGVVVDGDEVEFLARREGVEPGALLALLARAGVSAVGVHEYTLGEALADGRLFALPRETLALVDSPLAGDLPDDVAARSTIVGWSRAALAGWLADALNRSLPALGRRLTAPDHPYELWEVPGSLPNDLPLGFDPLELERAAAAGLGIVPRLAGGGSASLLTLDARVAPLAAYDVPAVVFRGLQVAGYPDRIDEAAAVLAPLGAPVGLIEFNPQAGFAALAEALGYRIVRVHSITDREMAAPIAEQVAWERWLRAVRERGIGLLYVRMYLQGAQAGSADGGLVRNLRYIEELVSRLRTAGYRIGEPPPVADRAPRIWALAAAVLLAGAACGRAGAQLLAALLRNVSRPPWVESLMRAAPVLGSFLLSLAFWALWLLGRSAQARQGAALAVALAFPVLAVAAGWERAGGGRAERGQGGRGGAGNGVDAGAARALPRAVFSFLAAVLVSLAGAALLVVLLDDVRFVAAIELFRGVKVAHVAPLAAVALWLWPWLRRGARSAAWRSPWLRWLAGAVLISGLAVYVLRTGNYGLPILDVEEQARRLLEAAFGARPRTKEFLLGHPALLLAFWLSAGGRRGAAAAAAAVLGAIGQISILNTFSHAHAPVGLSLARTGYGLLLGFLLGCAAVALAAWLDRRGWPFPLDRSGRYGAGAAARTGARRGPAATGGAPFGAKSP